MCMQIEAVAIPRFLIYAAYDWEMVEDAFRHTEGRRSKLS